MDAFNKAFFIFEKALSHSGVHVKRVFFSSQICEWRDHCRKIRHKTAVPTHHSDQPADVTDSFWLWHVNDGADFGGIDIKTLTVDHIT
jgi:hypothetical protein